MMIFLFNLYFRVTFWSALTLPSIVWTYRAYFGSFLIKGRSSASRALNLGILPPGLGVASDVTQLRIVLYTRCMHKFGFV